MLDYAPQFPAAADHASSPEAKWTFAAQAQGLTLNDALLSGVMAAFKLSHPTASAARNAPSRQPPAIFQAERIAGHCASG